MRMSWCDGGVLIQGSVNWDMKDAKKILVNSLLAMGLVASASTVLAATDGTTGTTSTGNLIINATINEMIKISNMADIPLGTFAGVDLTGGNSACVYHNGVDTYSVTATSTNGSGTVFQLSDGTTDIAYTLDLNDGTSAHSMDSAVNDNAFTGADTASESCGGTPNLAISVTITAAALAATPAGAYTDTLTLLVAPI